MASQPKDLIDLEKKLLEKEEKLEREKKSLEKEKEEIAELKREYREKLSKVSSLTLEEAKKELLLEVEEKEAREVARIIKEAEEKAKATADKKAQEILIDSMRHGALDYIAEFTLSTVKIPEEDIKGRIIGKGRLNKQPVLMLIWMRKVL